MRPGRERQQLRKLWELVGTKCVYAQTVIGLDADIVARVNEHLFHYEPRWVWLFLNDDTVYIRQGVTTNQCVRIGLSWGRLVVRNTVGHFPGGPRGCIEQHASHRNRSTRPVWSLKT
jgi:hypothetical protein